MYSYVYSIVIVYTLVNSRYENYSKVPELVEQTIWDDIRTYLTSKIDPNEKTASLLLFLIS